jgi:hypothetical protein
LRIKEQETRLTLHEHDDDDDETHFSEKGFLGFTTVKMVHGSIKAKNSCTKAVFTSHYPNPLVVTCYVIEDSYSIPEGGRDFYFGLKSTFLVIPQLHG